MENSDESELETPTSQLVGIGNNAEKQSSGVGSRALKRLLTSRLAWVLSIFGLVLYLLALYLAYLNRAATLPEGWGPTYGIVISTFPLLTTIILGLLIILRVHGNYYGWTWLILGLCFGAILPFGESYAIYTLMVSPDTLPFGWMVAYLAGYAWGIGLAMISLILLLFPNGKTPTSQWRVLVWIIGIALFVALATAWATTEQGMVPLERPNPIGGTIAMIIDAIGQIAVSILFLTIPLSAISLIHRYLRADGDVRQQLKWFAFGSLVFSIFLASDFLYTAPGVWEPVKESISFAILPVTVGIAILRYRLYDIDLIIRRTLQYTLLTGVLLLVYFGSILVLQNLFENLTGQQSPIVIVISTLAIAALFNPLRLRVQAFIDRRFYRRKYDAEQTLASFAASARDEMDLEDLQNQILTVVEDTLQPESLSLWLKEKTR